MIIGYLGAFMASVAWAIGTARYAEVSKDYPPYVINTTRAATAILPFLIWALFLPGSSWHAVNSDQILWLSIAQISSYALGDVFFFLSLRFISPSSTLAVSSVYPVFSLIGGVYFKGDHLSVWQGLGVLMAVVGVVFVILGGEKSLSQQSQRGAGKGYFLALVTALFWSLNTYSVSRGSEGLEVALVGLIRMTVALVLCPLFGFAMSKHIRWPLIRRADFKSHGWVFLLESFGGGLFYVLGFKYAPLGIAAALSSLAPVVIIPFEVYRQKRFPSLLKSVGIFLVVLGVVMMS